MNAIPFPLVATLRPTPPSQREAATRGAGEIWPDLRSPLPALHVKQGAEIFRDQRADYDFHRLEQRFGFSVSIYCLAVAAAASLYIGFWQTLVFLFISAACFSAGLLARSRGDAILQRSMAVSIA